MNDPRIPLTITKEISKSLNVTNLIKKICLVPRGPKIAPTAFTYNPLSPIEIYCRLPPLNKNIHSLRVWLAESVPTEY